MRLRILTWPTRPRYLRSLAALAHDIHVVTGEGREPLPAGWRWPDNVKPVAEQEVRRLRLDCVIFQSREAWLEDRHRLLSEEQELLPRVDLEHDPPLQHPTDERHPVDDPDTLLVHVSHFNALAWASGRTPVRVIEPGVEVADAVFYSGKLPRGLTAIDGLAAGGRRLGRDVFEALRAEVPIDLVGKDARALGGLGEVPPQRLAEFASSYRFYVDPQRHAGLSLELCEAMMVGLPVIALATGGKGALIRNGVSGYLDSNPRELVARMRELLASPGEAWRLAQGARRVARERCDLRRFTRDWDHALRSVAGAARFVAPWAAPGVGA